MVNEDPSAMTTPSELSRHARYCRYNYQHLVLAARNHPSDFVVVRGIRLARIIHDQRRVREASRYSLVRPRRRIANSAANTLRGERSDLRNAPQRQSRLHAPYVNNPG